MAHLFHGTYQLTPFRTHRASHGHFFWSAFVKGCFRRSVTPLGNYVPGKYQGEQDGFAGAVIAGDVVVPRRLSPIGV